MHDLNSIQVKACTDKVKSTEMSTTYLQKTKIGCAFCEILIEIVLTWNTYVSQVKHSWE